MRIGSAYLDLRTSNKRKEIERDHLQLRRLMNQEWGSIRDFYKKPPEEINDFQFQRVRRLVKRPAPLRRYHLLS